MAYIGVQPTAGQYRKLDNISASFNGSTTSFTTSVGGTNVTAGTAQQLIVSLGGVIQQPDTDYTVSTNTITFTTAPTSGLDFFAILMGDALNTVTPSDGSVTTSKLAGSLSVGLTAGSVSAPSLFFTGDTNNGIYSPAADQLAVTTSGTQRLVVDSTGQIEAKSLGTAAAPVWTFVDDPNTGFWSPTADTLAASTNGFERLRITSAGNVGIGTTSPGAPLDVVGGTAGSFNAPAVFIQNNKFLTFRNATGNWGMGLIVDDANNSYTFGLNNLIFGTGSSATERARIDSAGRWLLNTSTARSTGTVNWLAQIEGGYTTGLGITANSNDAAGAYLSLAKSRGATVGSNTIVQANDGLGYILFSGADGSTANTQGGYIGCEVDATPGASKIPGRLVFYTASSGSPSVMLERMRITSDGTIRSANVNGSNIVCINNGATNTALIYFQTSGAELGKIRINGAGVAYDTTSDYRLKENIEPITDAVSRLQALKPWRFNFISHPDVTVDGFLAHEAQEVVPEAVGGHKDEEDAEGNPVYQGIDQSKLVPLLTAALQEAIGRIETLEAEVAALKAQ